LATKVKCQGRDEFIVLGWTPPEGTRRGLGSLHLGFHDEQRALHYVGGVGTGFSEQELGQFQRRLSRMATLSPEGLLLAGEAQRSPGCLPSLDLQQQKTRRTSLGQAEGVARRRHPLRGKLRAPSPAFFASPPPSTGSRHRAQGITGPSSGVKQTAP
jgi:hypothetical protein